jgi:hypothetical protein
VNIQLGAWDGTRDLSLITNEAIVGASDTALSDIGPAQRTTDSVEGESVPAVVYAEPSLEQQRLYDEGFVSGLYSADINI